MKPKQFRAMAERLTAITNVDEMEEKVKEGFKELLRRANRKYIAVFGPRNGYDSVTIEEIVYIEADGKYSLLHLWENDRDVKRQSGKNIGHLEWQLLNAGFIRIHHSYIINTKWLKRFDVHDHSVELKSNMVLPVSDKYLHELKEYYDINRMHLKEEDL